MHLLINKKTRDIILTLFAVFVLALVLIPPFRQGAGSFFGHYLNAAFGSRKNSGGKSVTFAMSVKVLGSDEAGQKIKGIGTGGSHTGAEFLYEEMEFDLAGADLRNLRGSQVSFQDVAGAESIFIHGLNNRDGTFRINKVIIEP